MPFEDSTVRTAAMHAMFCHVTVAPAPVAVVSALVWEAGHWRLLSFLVPRTERSDLRPRHSFSFVAVEPTVDGNLFRVQGTLRLTLNPLARQRSPVSMMSHLASAPHVHHRPAPRPLLPGLRLVHPRNLPRPSFDARKQPHVSALVIWPGEVGMEFQPWCRRCSCKRCSRQTKLRALLSRREPPHRSLPPPSPDLDDTRADVETKALTVWQRGVCAAQCFHWPCEDDGTAAGTAWFENVQFSYFNWLIARILEKGFFSILRSWTPTSSLVSCSDPCRVAFYRGLLIHDMRQWCHRRCLHQPACTTPPTLQPESSFHGAIWIVLPLDSDPLPVLLQPVTGGREKQLARIHLPRRLACWTVSSVKFNAGPA